MKPVKEAVTEWRSIRYAESKGCLHYKQNGLGRMAKPDQLFVTLNGYDWWVEFKREGEEPTKLQVLEASKLIGRHQLHSFIWRFEEFQFKLDWLLKLPVQRAPSGW